MKAGSGTKECRRALPTLCPASAPEAGEWRAVQNRLRRTSEKHQYLKLRDLNRNERESCGACFFDR
jgi:hypothetical protein